MGKQGMVPFHGPLKKALGKTFSSDKEVQTVVNRWLYKQSKEFLHKRPDTGKVLEYTH
jgi:hypothetical protein